MRQESFTKAYCRLYQRMPHHTVLIVSFHHSQLKTFDIFDLGLQCSTVDMHNVLECLACESHHWHQLQAWRVVGSKLGDRWKHQGIAGVSSDSSMDVSIWQQRSNLISEDNLGVQGQSTRAHLALGWCSSSEPFLKCYHVVESHIESPSSAILKGTRWKEMEGDQRFCVSAFGLEDGCTSPAHRLLWLSPLLGRKPISITAQHCMAAAYWFLMISVSIAGILRS